MKRKQVERHVKQLRIKDGDVIMVRKWLGFTDKDQAKITAALTNRLDKLDGVVLVFVDSLSDIRTLNEKQMQAYDWVRTPRK